MNRWTFGFLAALTLPPAALGQDAPLPPDKAAQHMTVPEGFRVTLCASEPQLVKPIAMTVDDRGRLWVVEAHSYPHWRTDGGPGADRILIFEDRTGKGRFDSCTVFWDKGANLSGIAVGFGGVWLCATPNLLFIPVRPGEDRPAGPPVVVLDGWSLKARHNVFNGLTWGPDGWLYGCNGITDTSRVGKPGTPDNERVRFNCGVWRYHPIKQRFEPFAWGTTNPWGLDFDDYGEMFITNCVIKHLFHVVPGAHFVRMFGEDLNPHCYGLIESCADHIHWAGGHWTSSRGAARAHSDAGGGHAHAGALVYLGDNWPDEYRNRIFMCNLHGNRLNQDILEPHGSGYVAHHGKDFLFARDPWFRGLALKGAADGGVFVSDWCDTGECHNNDKVQPYGRIYKVTYGQPAAVRIDLAKFSDEELVRLQLHKNDWWVRHARRLLQERAAAGKLSEKVRPLLLKMLAEQPAVTRKLRALWALHGIGGLDARMLSDLLDHPEAPIRAWTVRLLVEDGQVSTVVQARLARMAKEERSTPVRLALASALQRHPLPGVAEGLVARAEDANDPYLPLMIWYGIERRVAESPDHAAKLLVKVRIPLVRQNIARRMVEAAEAQSPASSKNGWTPLVCLLVDAKDADVPLEVLHGMYAALKGRRQVPMPGGWLEAARKLAASPNAEVRHQALMLSVMFGDLQAAASLRKTAADTAAEEATRQTALQSLIDLRATDVLPLLRDLLADRTMRAAALRGLAAFNDPTTPEVILSRYPSFSDAEKADAVNTLASRPEYAMALLVALERGQVPRRDLSPFTARQLLNFKNKRLSEKLNAVWGTIRPPAKDKTALMARYKALVPPDALSKADRAHGRAVFARTCANCHTLFSEGGKIGPDLTGSQRTNPEYILTKLLDPNAAVAKDFQVSIVTTVNGRFLTGIVTKENDKTMTVQTPNELVTLPKSDVQERQKTAQSIMPQDQLGQMTDVEFRDLIAYLAGTGQVPLPANEKGINPKTVPK